tara:strand:- start:18365 stop:18760 length:396 start_codon:yes stop_codon:yes gene_type:complete
VGPSVSPQVIRVALESEEASVRQKAIHLIMSLPEWRNRDVVETLGGYYLGKRFLRLTSMRALKIPDNLPLRFAPDGSELQIPFNKMSFVEGLNYLLKNPSTIWVNITLGEAITALWRHAPEAVDRKPLCGC